VRCVGGQMLNEKAGEWSPPAGDGATAAGARAGAGAGSSVAIFGRFRKSWMETLGSESDGE